MSRLAVVLGLLAALLAPAPGRAEPVPVRILAVGDSITAAGRWQAELDRLLTAAAVPHVIETEALSGSRCNRWPGLMPGILAAHQPDLVVLACGTNDDPNELCYGEPCTGWAWRSIVEQVHTYRPGGALVLPALIQYSDPLIAPDWLLSFEPRTNDAVYAQWSRYPSSWFAGLVDLQRVPATADDLDAGGVHPTERGYRAYGRLVYDAAAAAMGWPAATDPPLCGLYGHRRGYPRPSYTPCP